MDLRGCKLIIVDYSFDLRKGGVCMYYRKSLAVKVMDTSFLSQCILCEVSLDNKVGYVAVVF